MTRAAFFENLLYDQFRITAGDEVSISGNSYKPFQMSFPVRCLINIVSPLSMTR
jgi:hypothetical protein